MEEEDDYTAFLRQFTADYRSAHPEEYAAFDPDAWFSQEWGWWTREEYMENFGVTEEGFRDAMWEEVLCEAWLIRPTTPSWWPTTAPPIPANWSVTT